MSATATVPLSPTTLSHLLGTALRDIDTRLRRLHSVLSVPTDPAKPARLLHTSFPDFLVDACGQRQNRFYIDEKPTHGRLAQQCLQLLDRT